jgi:hypothetical protein
MLRLLDSSGIDYLTLLETKDNQWYVEGFIINAGSSMQIELKQKITSLIDKYGFVVLEQEDGLVVYKK